MGSKSRELRDKVTRIRIAESELMALKAAAAESGVSVGEFVRRAARQAAGLGPTFGEPVRSEIHNLAEQVRAIGININQITRAIHTGLAPGKESLLEELGFLVAVLDETRRYYLDLCSRGQKAVTEPLAQAGTDQ